jgi:hypothetical protein
MSCLQFCISYVREAPLAKALCGGQPLRRRQAKSLARAAQSKLHWAAFRNLSWFTRILSSARQRKLNYIYFNST